MSRPFQPLAEVFGRRIDDQSAKATRYRSNRLCPFNNQVLNCTKAKNPLGVCNIFHDSDPAITCPIRFREDWLITDDAASFFFKDTASWSSLTEIRLNDVYGKSAGNIDVVLVAYDGEGQICDFGALEGGFYFRKHPRALRVLYEEFEGSRSNGLGISIKRSKARLFVIFSQAVGSPALVEGRDSSFLRQKIAAA